MPPAVAQLLDGWLTGKATAADLLDLRLAP
jgi:hypothetical protein